MIGQEKGNDTESRLQHNFGMARPEGYRKAVRLMELADRFDLPVIALVDTAGAFPGVDAEERGQAEAIARSIDACLSLGVPNVAVIIGEGGSGGAVAIATANKVLMLEHAIYTVASPEASASILWRDSSRAQDAATSMKITAQDLHQVRHHRYDHRRAARRRASRSGRRGRRDRPGDQRGAEVAPEHEPRGAARRAGGKVSRHRAESLDGHPISITAPRARRGASLRMSAAPIATQPAVGARPSRAKWKKIALPRPLARREKFWSSTKVRS